MVSTWPAHRHRKPKPSDIDAGPLLVERRGARIAARAPAGGVGSIRYRIGLDRLLRGLHGGLTTFDGLNACSTAGGLDLRRCPDHTPTHLKELLHPT